MNGNDEPNQENAVLGSEGVIRNDEIWHDTDGNEIYCNGGNMIQEGNTFYWVGYETAPGRPWKIHLYSSTNLADWRFENTVISKAGAFEKFGGVRHRGVEQGRGGVRGRGRGGEGLVNFKSEHLYII